MLIHSMLCGFLTKRYEIRLTNEPFFAAIDLIQICFTRF